MFLPIKLEYFIFSFVDERRDLQVICLCCKCFNTIVQPMLFKEVELHDDNPGSPPLMAEFTTFYRLLHHSPDLAEHVKSLALVIEQEHSPETSLLLEFLVGRKVEFIHLFFIGVAWTDLPLKLTDALEILFTQSPCLVSTILQQYGDLQDFLVFWHPTLNT
ncbi:hypothetical protein BDZ97DRAFT_1926375 [Flammula alnicola]|nr:hypothetical protein BDZ97DRAFT_1926375 [Flammula alnicola]